MQRNILTGFAVLCILAASLLFSTGNVHAQTNVSLAPQHATVANDQPSYPFWAGGWGWGQCFSHSDIQSIDGGSNHGRGILLNYVGWRFGGGIGFAASLVVEGLLWYLEAIDRGNGDCIAFAYGLWWLPVAWAR